MLKKLLLGVCLAFGMALFADNHSSITFELSGGNPETISSKDLSITFEEGKMFAQSAFGSIEIPFSSIQKFYFTDDSSSISEVEDINGEVRVFTMTGLPAGNYSSVDEAKKSLQVGIYLVKEGKRTYKILVK